MKLYQKIGLGVILVIALAGGFYFYSAYHAGKNKPVACTQEAKLCPDGSYVGRTGPKCEFTKCPVENPIPCTEEAKLCPDGSYVGRTGPNCEFAKCPAENIKSGISGIVLLGPTCPVERIPPDPKCADRPYQTSFILTMPNSTQIIKEFSSDAEGKFKLNLSPGNYMIKTTSINILPRCADSEAITVQAETYTDIVINCDTGIR